MPIAHSTDEAREQVLDLVERFRPQPRPAEWRPLVAELYWAVQHTVDRVFFLRIAEDYLL